MKVKVKLFSSLRNEIDNAPRIGDPLEVDIDQGKTIGDLIETIGLDPSEVAIILVNHIHQSKNYIIEDETDKISLFPVSGGG